MPTLNEAGLDEKAVLEEYVQSGRELAAEQEAADLSAAPLLAEVQRKCMQAEWQARHPTAWRLLTLLRRAIARARSLRR